MFKNYFKIAVRQLRKQRMYSAVKIGGFALSIAACLLIALYIKDELSYDKNWTNADRIYRIIGEYNINGKMLSGAAWPAPMAKALKEDFPEVEKAGRFMDAPLFYGAGSNQLRKVDEEQNTFEQGFSYADQDMLDMLEIPMVYGDRAHALSEPNTMVISKSKADKYFPNQNPVGKVMILNNDVKNPYKIGGVINDFPATSHIHYDFLLTMTRHQLWDGEQTTWMASNYPTYVLLKPGADPVQFQNKLKLIMTKYYLPALRQNGNKEAETVLKNAKILIQPIADVHLYSANIDDRLDKGDIRFVWLFGAIAVFILVIACINFINLSTAKSANRAKEVGLRKVVGSHRSSLIKQFLTESLLYSVLSFVLGLLIAIILLPYFNTLAAKHLLIPWAAWWLLPLMITAAIIIGIVAGLYPSFYLSSFKPIQVLKGQVSKGSKNSLLRNGLVVFQFTTSIILIIGTIVIYNQTQYILNKKIGFDKDQVLLIQGTNTLEDKREAFKNELLKSSEIKTVSISDYLPIAGTKRDGNPFWKEGRTKEDPSVGGQKWQVDYDYLKTMGMHMIEGRYFSKDMASDSAAAVINNTMATKLGLKNPVGQRIENGWQKFTVIGVMEDFNFESMRQDVTPLCLVLGNYNSSIISVKISGADTKTAINYVSSVWKNFSPNQPFRYTFLDESFANMYADVQRTGSIFTSFAMLAVIIACLGLFALSAFMAEQRNKEIGIRKVLGASVSGITTMLSKDFVKLVLFSIVIASPVAWWAMSKWLQDFAYRISMSWWMIAAAALVAIVIALITISFQSIKAALMNPVKSLRSE
ncbi:FtsX-like permease family protein [Panacibacter ginsenosidivorans]|uniref:FtsX-like permease family protein n=1 Tax=Panacibacter ginsenosidivorans TaxID=1813871 RepID=A0A5B8V4M2_9BACT|nr:ABC transporter permease [Panacibacter ginsenosidivorans]QEC65975.1 FtsX-like permease family protein [Panacibacter ginsenosidivorans]